MDKTKLILASASPRRRELLERMGLAYTALPVDADETTDLPPRQAVALLARRKAEAARRACAGGTGLILGADTLVSLEEQALGKPRDEDEARRMLKALSGRTHDVYTGVCLIDCLSGRTVEHVEGTRVAFRDLSVSEIDAYVQSGEPMGKAGAYAIQGGAGRFVAAIDGSFENVMGLPTQALKRLLKEFGL